MLRRTEGISVSASLATIIVERVFDGLVMLLFVFFALPFVGVEHIPPVYRITVIVASVAFFAALLVFLWMAFDQRAGDPGLPLLQRPAAARALPGRRWMASSSAS